MMEQYCLGYTHKKCEDCQHAVNWQMLNQMPDALRKPVQAQMSSIDIDKCRLTGMGEYAAPKPEVK